jgi:predicted metal-dependent hydrolase
MVLLPQEDREALRRGAEEFNTGYYFECHDTLEEAWAGIRGEARDFFQGLIQVSVGLYHWRNGNAGGAATMLERATKRLSGYPATFCGLDLGALRPEVEEALRRVKSGEAFPETMEALPRYRLSDTT